MEKHSKSKGNIEGYIIRGFPQTFSKIFKEWFKYIHLYNDSLQEDCIYWHNERAAVGSLAAAIVRTNNPVLEEYPDLKGGKGKEYSGRIDLFFVYDDEWFLVEAKHECINFEKLTTDINLESLIEKACDDAHIASKGKDKTAFGLTFIVPKVSDVFLKRGPTSFHSQLTEFVNSIVAVLKKDKTCDFIAYCAPKANRELSFTVKDKRFFYPMVIMLARKVGKKIKC